jgi:hypothetical protein
LSATVQLDRNEACQPDITDLDESGEQKVQVADAPELLKQVFRQKVEQSVL